MKHYMLLSLLLALGCVHVRGAPLAQEGMEQGSCEDASAIGAAGLALTKINQHRLEGYVFALHRLSNVHMTKHGDTGLVFYLTLDVVETNCSVLRKDWKACAARPTHDTPVYGQCKVVIYICKVHRVVRLYKYDCVVRPVPGARVNKICPDCPSLIGMDNAEVQKALSLSLEKFNSESGLSNRFALLKVNRATAGMAMSMYYNVEYTIQETTCTNSSGAADKCPVMDCEFAHKGFCKASLSYSPSDEADISVDCEIYEPEAAETEKTRHLLGGETDHSHKDTHTHSNDHGAHGAHTNDNDRVHAAHGAHTNDNDRGHAAHGAHKNDNDRGHAAHGAHTNDNDRGHAAHGAHTNDNDRGHAAHGAHKNDNDRGHAAHGAHTNDNDRGHAAHGAHKNDNDRGHAAHGAHTNDNDRGHAAHGAHTHDHDGGHAAHGAHTNDNDRVHAAHGAHTHDHDGVHAADGAHTHDHDHDHTKSHAHHDDTQKHDNNSDHHHTHDHEVGSGHRHAHDHSHDHGHDHDHVHTHHAKAHNHSAALPNHHHDYKHADGTHTHEHDHELALDHDHMHVHLHEHEHHHHHHDHIHETTAHDHPESMVRFLPAMDGPMTLPSVPDVPAGGPEVAVTLPLKADPQIPGQMEPIIQAFPKAVSANCTPAAAGDTLVEKVFAEDPMFKPAA